jgi:hypothetical protein
MDMCGWEAVPAKDPAAVTKGEEQKQQQQQQQQRQGSRSH